MKLTREILLVLKSAESRSLRVSVGEASNEITPMLIPHWKTLCKELPTHRDFFLNFWTRESYDYNFKGYMEVKDNTVVASTITSKMLAVPSLGENCCPGLGYSPAALEHLRVITGLPEKKFQKEFSIDQETYEDWKQGATHLNWEQWKTLQEDVLTYLRTTLINGEPND